MTGSSGVVPSNSGGRLTLLTFTFLLNFHMFVSRIAEVTLHAERGLSFLALDVDGGTLPGSPEMDELN